MITVTTYNIHHGRGLDRRVRLKRIAHVLERAQTDLMALQELDRFRRRTGMQNQAEELAAFLNFHFHFSPAWDSEAGGYGLAILSRFPILGTQPIALPAVPKSREARTAIVAEIDHPDGRLNMLNTHLSLYKRERHLQVEALIRFIGKNLSDGIPFLVCGDFNATPGSSTLSALTRAVNPSTPPILFPKTFTSWMPFRCLDYIIPSPDFHIIRHRAPRSPIHIIASDHLPLVSSLKLKTKRTTSKTQSTVAPDSTESL